MIYPFIQHMVHVKTHDFEFSKLQMMDKL